MAFGIARKFEERASDLGTDVLYGSNTVRFTRLILFALFFVGLSLLAVIVLVVRAVQASRDIKDLQQRLRTLENRFDRARPTPHAEKKQG